MKLILLQGLQNCGKTTALNQLRNWLISDLSGIELHFEEINKKGDFQSVIKCNNKQIAMFSMGDLKGECIKAIFKYLGVDILVLAESEGKIPLLNDVPLKLKYTNISGSEPPAHVVIKMEKKTIQQEMVIEENQKLEEILAEIKKSI